MYLHTRYALHIGYPVFGAEWNGECLRKRANRVCIPGGDNVWRRHYCFWDGQKLPERSILGNEARSSTDRI
jgi:hypothetical protein